jgi:general secretion pathway protein G
MKKHLNKLTTGAARGMTLIEIMVVVFILGLIATVVAVNVVGVQDDAQIKAAKLDIKGFQNALDLYRLKKGRYPNSSEGLTSLYSDGLLKGELKKDPWGNDYVYLSPGTKNPKGYDIVSYGPDRNSGGGDDIAGD